MSINKNSRNLSLPAPTPFPRLKVLNADGDVVEWTPENDEFFLASEVVIDATEVQPGHWA